jgi:hypothetical protein
VASGWRRRGRRLCTGDRGQPPRRNGASVEVGAGRAHDTYRAQRIEMEAEPKLHPWRESVDEPSAGRLLGAVPRMQALGVMVIVNVALSRARVSAWLGDTLACSSAQSAAAGPLRADDLLSPEHPFWRDLEGSGCALRVRGGLALIGSSTRGRELGPLAEPLQSALVAARAWLHCSCLAHWRSLRDRTLQVRLRADDYGERPGARLELLEIAWAAGCLANLTEEGESALQPLLCWWARAERRGLGSVGVALQVLRAELIPAVSTADSVPPIALSCDASLPQLIKPECTWREERTAKAEMAWLGQRIRLGDVSDLHARVAAYCGHPAATHVVGVQGVEQLPRSWRLVQPTEEVPLLASADTPVHATPHFRVDDPEWCLADVRSRGLLAESAELGLQPQARSVRGMRSIALVQFLAGLIRFGATEVAVRAGLAIGELLSQRTEAGSQRFDAGMILENLLTR